MVKITASSFGRTYSITPVSGKKKLITEDIPFLKEDKNEKKSLYFMACLRLKILHIFITYGYEHAESKLTAAFLTTFQYRNFQNGPHTSHIHY